MSIKALIEKGKIRDFLIAAKVVRDMPENLPLLDKIKRQDILDQAAVNALPEIEELVYLCRDMEHARGCSHWNYQRRIAGKPNCICGLDRIREMVER